MKDARFVPVADHAVSVEFGTQISDANCERVQALDRAIAARPPTGLREVVPAMVNALVLFDPLVTDHPRMIAALRELLGSSSAPSQPGTERLVNVCYDGDLAPDLAAVAQASGLDEAAVIDAHLAADYRVAMYGFAPGYAYLAGTPKPIQVPRKSAAVRDIPRGSVMIAGPQCLVTTLDMPTGWSIIGRSSTQILRSESDKPFLFDVGDRVRFQRVDRHSYEQQLRSC